jgi:hypothetical protein
MKHVSALRAIALAIVAASVVACGSDSSVAPDHPPADLGAVLTEMAVPSLAGSLIPGAPAMPDAAAPTPSSCTYDAASQSFACPAVTASGITLTRSFTLLSASGTPQSQFDPAATAAVRTNATMAGTITDAGNNVTLDGKDEFTLSGLRTGVHTLNGTSVTHMSGTYTKSPFPFTMTVTSTITDLVLPSATEKFPKSGTVVVDMTSLAQGTSTTSHMTMTYTSGGKVKVATTSGGRSLTCTVDLATQATSCN